MKLALGLLLVSTVASTTARADSKAWTAAKKVIPGNMQVVGGINAGSARSSSIYQSLLPAALAKASTASAQLDGIKADCGIDVIASIDSVVFGLDSTQTNGTVVIAFRGTNRAKLEACARKRAKAQQKTLSIASLGGLTKYSGLGDKDLYMRWIGADVVAISTTPDDQDTSLQATGGGIAGDHSLRGLGSVNTGASLWLVSNKEGDMPGDLGGKMTGAFGSANLAGGLIAVDLHVGVDSPKSASDAAAKVNAELDGMRTGSGGGGTLVDLLKTVKVTAAGAELQVTAQVAEKSVLDLLAMLGVHP